MKVYAYSGCDTCRKALKYLDAAGKPYELLAIRETPPGKAELKRMLRIYEGKVSKLFNTSGKDYRDMKLGERLKNKQLTDEQALDLLSKHGNLVKRPFVLAGNTGMVGFKLEEWKQKGFR